MKNRITLHTDFQDSRALSKAERKHLKNMELLLNKEVVPQLHEILATVPTDVEQVEVPFGQCKVRLNVAQYLYICGVIEKAGYTVVKSKNRDTLYVMSPNFKPSLFVRLLRAIAKIIRTVESLLRK